MKIRKSVLGQAVGATLLLAAGSAFAYVPASNTDADVTIAWGGATASSLSAMELTVASVCDTDPHILYVKATSGTPIDRPGNDWAVACRTAAAGATKTGLPNGLRMLVVKRDRGGSGVGVGAVQTKSTDALPAGGVISFLNVANTVCNIAVTPGVNGAPDVANPDGGSVPLVGCAATYSVSSFAEMGTSDIEPNKFTAINTPVVDSAQLPYLSDADRAFAEQSSLAALAFNTPVTLQLYRALQTAQFAATSVCNPTNAGYAAGIAVAGNGRTDITNGESEACMPSLTRSEINSILTGKIVLWTQLLNSAGAGIGATGAVQICRRVEGSGTQATINALISNYPCDANKEDSSIDIINPRNFSSAQLVLNSGSGDVDNCLHNFNASANPYAIGVLSIEGRNVDKSRNWRFIKIDGVSPTLKHIHDGDYYMWSQQSCQRRNAALPYNVDGGRPNDTVANKALVVGKLCAGINTTSILTKLNNPVNLANCLTGANLSECGSLYTWGASGWLATPTTSLLYDNVLATDANGLVTNPVNGYTREVTVGKVNICQTPVKASAGSNSGRGTIVAPNPISLQ